MPFTSSVPRGRIEAAPIAEKISLNPNAGLNRQGIMPDFYGMPTVKVDCGLKGVSRS